MTAAERLLWNKIQRRVGTMTPEMASAIMRSFQTVRDSMTEAQILRAIQLGGIDRLFDEVLTRAVMNVAYAPVKRTLRSNLVTAVTAYARTIPSAKSVSISFDFLNPRVIDAVRTLETRVITTLDDNIRETVRAYVENGLRDGVEPRTVARSLRTVIGLAPNQLQEVENLRDAMLGRNGRTLAGYTRRDTRYDRLVAAGEVTDAQVEKAVKTYTDRRIALNADANARTAASDAQKLAQRLSWEDAIEKGIIDRDRLMKQWITQLDGRERKTHHDMHGDRAHFDAPFRNGQMIPGENEFNCRCVPRYYQARSP